MKKKIVLSLMVICSLCFVVLSGCGSMKLSADYDEATVKTSAEGFVNDLNDRNYDKIYDSFTDTVKNVMTKDELKTKMNQYLDDAGSFTSIKSNSVIGQKDSKTGEDDAVAVVVTKYEKKNYVFTVSYDKKMQIAGFRIK